MAFYMYMLRCSDESIYVGHTDDLQRRLADHQNRRFSGYTSKRLPVRLIFSEQFATRDEAFAAERQVKAWRRSKKAALAAGRWDVIQELASVRSPERRARLGASCLAHGTSAAPSP